jgi:quinol-cytochrome oxidoreductase complex cytochrome b subunit
VGENALLRFYVLHCVILPLALGMGVVVHLWRVRKDGGVRGRRNLMGDAGES